MAGIRHHILPQFLLKGFASRASKDEVFTWVYRLENEAFETNIKNISVQRYFYNETNEADSPSVDDEITRLEGIYAPFIESIKSQKHCSKISDNRVLEFITHLSIRTNHIRDYMSGTVGFVAEQFHAYFSDVNNIKSLIFNNPEILQNAVEKAVHEIVDEYPMLKGNEKQFKSLALQLAPQAIDENHPEFKYFVEYFAKTAKELLPIMAKKYHIKLLAKHDTLPKRLEPLKSLKWFLYRSDQDLILGDIGCLLEINGAYGLKAFEERFVDVRSAFLPISKDCLIVGVSSPNHVFEVDPIQLNEEMAKSSREFFISSTENSETEKLRGFIGEYSDFLQKAKYEKLFIDVIQGK
jgi:hypothetical protein